jgi:energy-coupling factor transporter ATP-binding protein EcfA2
MEKGTAIKVTDLTWQYDQTDAPALQDINLEVEEGELVLITGASGAGKSTLCKALNGLIPHSYRGTGRGRVEVAGLVTNKHHTSELAEHIGMVFQDPDTQLVSMSVMDELVMGMERLQVPRDEMTARIEWVSKLLRVEDLMDRPPYQLSGGQKQRVAIASILAMKPNILILDEPTSELDPRGKEELFDSIRDLKQAGMTLVLVAHATEEAVPLADRIILMEHGKIVREGPPKQFFAEVDLVAERGVRIPQVIQLANRLHLDDIPLDIDEALPRLAKYRYRLHQREVNDLRGTEVVIRVVDLEHTYPDGLHALGGVNLTVRRGEMLAIVGQNGSGKTTLAKHFNKLLEATSGSVFINGENIEHHQCTRVSRQVGYVFQNPDFQICTNSVLDEARFGLVNMKLEPERIEGAANRALAIVGLENKKNEHPFNLSKGERQRLAVASVIAMEPPIIVFDEPTTGQDAVQSKEIMGLIKRLNEASGKTIIIITHDMELVADYCQRVVVLSHGKVLLDGSPQSVFSEDESLHEAFVRPPQITQVFRRLNLGPALSVDDVEVENGLPVDGQ